MDQWFPRRAAHRARLTIGMVGSPKGPGKLRLSRAAPDAWRGSEPVRADYPLLERLTLRQCRGLRSALQTLSRLAFARRRASFFPRWRRVASQARSQATLRIITRALARPDPRACRRSCRHFAVAQRSTLGIVRTRLRSGYRAAFASGGCPGGERSPISCHHRRADRRSRALELSLTPNSSLEPDPRRGFVLAPPAADASDLRRRRGPRLLRRGCDQTR